MAEKHVDASGGTYYTVSGEVTVWVEPGGPLMIKTRNPHGDPVELNEHETQDLIDLLRTLIAEIQ